MGKAYLTDYKNFKITKFFQNQFFLQLQRDKLNQFLTLYVFGNFLLYLVVRSEREGTFAQHPLTTLLKTFFLNTTYLRSK